MRVEGDSGGEAASLREAPLPQTLSPEERLAFGGLLLLTWFRLLVSAVPCKVVVVTAADRADAALRR